MSESLPHAIERLARHTPDAPALSWHESRWTYAELSAAIACVRGALKRSAVLPGSRIALLLRNSPQYAAAYYGVMAASSRSSACFAPGSLT